MKSFHASVLVFTFLVSFSLAATPTELIQRALGKQCQAKERATDRDFEEFITRSVPSTETSKCLFACVMETLNVLINNQPNLENTLEVTNRLTNGDQQAVQLAREIYNDCFPASIGRNRCETAYNFSKCYRVTLDRRGVAQK